MAVEERSKSAEALNTQFVEDGTCSASCPTSYAMDYTPRQIIAYFRARMLDKILGSNTVWMCASCYSCAARCPSGIKFTDLMYELKRLALQHDISPPHESGPILAQAFVDMVKRYGRNPEAKFMTTYTMRSNPFGGIKQLPLAARMWQRGRLKLGAETIRGIEDLRKIMDAVEAEEGSE
jgi:heterodisulfide reductase subunit C